VGERENLLQGIRKGRYCPRASRVEPDQPKISCVKKRKRLVRRRSKKKVKVASEWTICEMKVGEPDEGQQITGSQRAAVNKGVLKKKEGTGETAAGVPQIKNSNEEGSLGKDFPAVGVGDKFNVWEGKKANVLKGAIGGIRMLVLHSATYGKGKRSNRRGKLN